MPSRLTTRLRRLEARRPPVADPSYTHPEPPLGWCEELFRILHQYGYLHDVFRSWDVPEPEVAALAAALEEECADALTT
jgi:hypothetical protein